MKMRTQRGAAEAAAMVIWMTMCGPRVFWWRMSSELKSMIPKFGSCRWAASLSIRGKVMSGERCSLTRASWWCRMYRTQRYGELLDISERPLLEWENYLFLLIRQAKNYIRAETLKVPTYHAIISQYTHGQRKTNDLFTCSRYYANFLPSITSRSGWRVEGPWERLRTPRKSHVRGISKTKLCQNIATKHV